MAYIICEPCIGTKDSACVDVCPVDCIHPRKDEPDFATAEVRASVGTAPTARMTIAADKVLVMSCILAIPHRSRPIS